MKFLDGQDEIEVLARRADIVELVDGDPMHKPELVTASGYSRSTINRAIGDLEAAGYVVRAEDGYVATQAGQLAVDGYREFVAQQEAILEAEEVLTAVPREFDLPIELMADARIVTEEAGHRLFELLVAEMAEADSIRFVVPALADSRHLRLCHSHVLNGDLRVALQAPEGVLGDVAAEFPYVWDDLADASAFVAHRGRTLPFGIVLAREASTVRSITLFVADGGQVNTFVHARPATTDWVRAFEAVLEPEQEDVSGEVGSETNETMPSWLPDERLPATLGAEGFVAVDDGYFEDREPLDPTTAWRAGLALPEVAAGYAVERRTDGAHGDGDDEPGGSGDGPEARSLTELLRERLIAGENLALVGPQGSGKSTVCKSVICRWHADGDGAVLYRESGRGQPFEATSLLERAIDRAAGHVLVVVEDAVRPEANDVFDVIEDCAGRSDVSFLFDAREHEWRDLEEFPTDPSLHALRRNAIDTVTVPPLDERDCANLLDRAESVTGQQLDVDVEELLADLRRSTDGDDSVTPGVMTLLFRRLVRRIDPTRRTDPATTLDEVIDETLADLERLGDAALDTGVLVNALNAAGLRVAPADVYSIAAGDPDRADGVEDGLDRLFGTVLFRSPKSRAYRTVHETWSARFLERFLENDPEAARRRFGACLTAFLSLADDQDRREAVAESVDDEDALAPVVTNPSEWADETVSTLFALGRAYPKLAALFGTTTATEIRLPDACSVQTRVRTAEWRGRMSLSTEALKRAEQEFEWLWTAADRLSGTAATRARVSSCFGRAEVAMRRGHTDAAEDHARTGLDLAVELSDTVLRSRARRLLGTIAETRGDLEEAHEQYLDSLELERERVGDSDGLASAHEKIGSVAMKQGNLETASDHLERALEHFRGVDDRSGEVECLSTLGTVAMKRNAIDDARQYLGLALDRYREVGDRQSVSATLSNLGLTALRAGDPEAARECFEECLDLDRELSDRRGEAQSRNCLGETLQRLGLLEAAGDHLRASLERYREMGDERGEAFALGSLGTIARKEGRLETARERHRQSLEGKRAVGDQQGEALSLDNLGVVARLAGALDESREYHREALELQRATDDRHGEALTLVHRGQVAMAAGNRDAAERYYTEALDVAADADVAVARGRARRRLGTLEWERDDVERALDHFESALAVFEANGYRLDELGTRGDVVEIAIEAGLDDVAREQYRRVVDRFEGVDGALADERERVEQLLAGAERLMPIDS